MAKLNEDILFLLFEELQDDPKSLFSCLMVNKFWCETTIPILWRNPWNYENNINYKNKSSLYHIIINSLSNDKKEFLKSQEVQLPPISRHPILFDYLSFCKGINVNVINDIIPIGTSTYNRFLLKQEIYILLMGKCLNLKYLDIRSIEHQIFYFPEAKARLNSLCELKFDTSIDSIYFYGLARICDNIEKLIIINTILKINHGIIKLIEVQRNLKYFEWNDDIDNFMELDDIYEEIFLTLAKKAHTLTHFITNFHDEFEYTFPPKILPELRNLKTLKLNFHPTFEFYYYEKLVNSVYYNLEILQLGNFTYLDTVACIIKNTGGRIRKILIDNYYTIEDKYHFYDGFIFLIGIIYDNCPLIESLSLALSSSEGLLVEFEKLLKVCHNLKVLELSMSSIDEMEESHERLSASREELLKILIRSASFNLREINFFEYFKFTLETLENFLENWRGRCALSIFVPDFDDHEEEKYTDMINRFKNDGVLKDFKRVIKREMNIDN
ncbi:hypothetical protein C1645_588243 [Glomus cerebriforme]|uniref:F-box domain-containing protein n=1 Tax=Glomus cerebriforme TaxID=658196 RepID=A0A397TPW8_9GLOM|nr:hypothetical protein C1645_588243 [Glomus cerebriforme]